jgi:hypothetical protein
VTRLIVAIGAVWIARIICSKISKSMMKIGNVTLLPSVY